MAAARDDTAALARPLADFVIASARGRAVQMNAGAALARGDVLLFLHADTRLPDDADRLVLDGLTRSNRAWGRFDVAIEGAHPLLPVVAAAMNLRSRLTGIATGDQAMFVTREAFDSVGGFPEIALMEDITFARNLKRVSRPLCLSARVTTSGRRWEQPRRAAHDPADVAAAAGVFLRREAGRACAPLRLRRSLIRRVSSAIYPVRGRPRISPTLSGTALLLIGDLSWHGSFCFSQG